jgi:hypothetical protein
MNKNAGQPTSFVPQTPASADMEIDSDQRARGNPQHTLMNQDDQTTALARGDPQQTVTLELKG